MINHSKPLEITISHQLFTLPFWSSAYYLLPPWSSWLFPALLSDTLKPAGEWMISDVWHMALGRPSVRCFLFIHPQHDHTFLSHGTPRLQSQCKVFLITNKHKGNIGKKTWYMNKMFQQYSRSLFPLSFKAAFFSCFFFHFFVSPLKTRFVSNIMFC